MRVAHNSLATNKPVVIGFPIKQEFRSVGFCGRSENLEKNLLDKDEDQQQSQQTYDRGSRNQTQATFVGGKCSRNCTFPAPQSKSANSSHIQNVSHC